MSPLVDVNLSGRDTRLVVEMSPLVDVTLPGGDTRLVVEHWLTNRGISLLSHITQLYMVFVAR